MTKWLVLADTFVKYKGFVQNELEGLQVSFFFFFKDCLLIENLMEYYLGLPHLKFVLHFVNPCRIIGDLTKYKTSLCDQLDFWFKNGNAKSTTHLIFQLNSGETEITVFGLQKQIQSVIKIF